MIKSARRQWDGPVLVFYEKSKFDFDPRFPRRSTSGFHSWYTRLCTALEQTGYYVRRNDFEFARAHPDHPVGIVGHRNILERWELSNPAVLGPSLYDHPMMNPALMSDARFRYYLVTAAWFRRLFVPFYGDRCVLWYAGIEVNKWQPVDGPKDLDFLIYDKIRWDRPQRERDLLTPVVSCLRKRNRSFEILRYGNHSHDDYRRLLHRSHAMLFMTEMETQGMAYQEALSSGLPVLAWDPGYWLDPEAKAYEPNPVPATSVPYFSELCGEKFRGAEDFPEVLELFESRIGTYRPRQYVRKSLSLEGSAELYIQYYSDTS